ncbi:hypothetical protein [Streptomyces sp. NPDC018000]|uniref:hypothetical protein n=1 Tax=Streptomyces sp. NPDC018000 TaxID=3365028 RepID=UPI0037988C5C
MRADTPQQVRAAGRGGPPQLQTGKPAVGQEQITTGRAARDEARHVLREAWRLGIEHQVQLDVLAASGLLAYDTPRAG